SMGEVEEAIQTTDDHSPSSVVRRPSSDHYRQLAHDLADALCAMARPYGERGLAWCDDPELDWHINARNISVGSAGVVLALAEAYQTRDDGRWTIGSNPPSSIVHRPSSESLHDAVAQGARWLRTAAPVEGEPLPSLYTGEAGVAVAMLRAGQVLHDSRLIEAA